MAAHMDFFRKLGSGAKFDFRRFKSDAERFQIIKSSPSSQPDNITKSLDLFGTHQQPRTTDGATLSSQLSNKRKGTEGVEEGGKAKNKVKEKKQKNTGVDDESNSVVKTSPRKKSHKTEIDDTNGDHENEEDSDDSINSDGDDDSAEEEAEMETGSNHGDITLMKFDNDKAGKDLDDDDEGGELDIQDQERHQSVKAFRKQHKIHVLGTDVPEPVGTFHEMRGEYRMHIDIIENIHRAGYVSPTAIQMQAIPCMMHRRELLACAPTGSGKTAAFILPVLQHLKEPRRQGFRAVVVSPSRELAQQTYREFVRLADGRGFRIHTIDNTAKAAKKFGPQSAGKFDILVTTPNRLVYMLQQDPPTIKLNNVEWLIVDESDKLFEGGKTGFREQLATIYQACDSSQVRRAMFSATFTHDVEQWCELNLDNVVMVTVGQRNAATETVKQELMFVGDEYGKLLAVRDIFKKGFLPPVLIFVQSKDRAKELFQELIYDGYNVDVIHADRTQQQRDNVVRSFRAGKIWVLIATELMGRGIDFKGVNLVINYDFPTSAISYIHRIGRTGRAGREGSAVTFFTEDDIVQLRSIANVMRNAGCPVPEYMLQLKKLSTKSQKKLQRGPMKRKTIRTLPTPELEKARKKRKMIKGKGHKGDNTADKFSKRKQKKNANKTNQNALQKPTKEPQNTEQQPREGNYTQGASESTNYDGVQKRTKKKGKKMGKRNGGDKRRAKDNVRTMNKKAGARKSKKDKTKV